MSKLFLKVKIKSLAAEAKIIRQMANKPRMVREEGLSVKVPCGFYYSSEMRFDLHSHRRFDVRREARSAQLAYGFLRSKSYRSMEEKCWDAPDETRIVEIAVKFGKLDKKQAAASIKEWLSASDEKGQGQNSPRPDAVVSANL